MLLNHCKNIPKRYNKMQDKDNKIPKFSYGVIPELARRLGIANKAAQARIRNGNIEAIKVAISIEESRRHEREKVQKQLDRLANTK
jgi:hypothetical protein